MRRMLQFALCLGPMAALAAPVTAGEPAALWQQTFVSSVATPRVMPAPLVVQSPGMVEIEVKIEPTDETEELRITADSGAHFRSSTIWLTGKDSQKVHTFEWHGFPAGEYEVVGELIAASGHREVVVRGALLVIE